MSSNFSTLDLNEIARLISEAERKLTWWDQKIRVCIDMIERLERKLLPISAALQYANRASERGKLVGLFQRDGEYGLPLDLPADLMDALQSRSTEIKQRIDHFRQRKSERESQVEFMKSDIELLKQVQALNLDRDTSEYAIQDD